MSSGIRHSLIYALAGQAGWFVCVLSAAHGAGWLGTLCVVGLGILHLRHVPHPRDETCLCLCVALLGWLWDSVPVHYGWLRYPSGMVLTGFAPYWMASLWVLFALQINTLYRWLRVHHWLASAIGCAAGPLSFRAGAALGAVEFARPLVAWIALGAAWAVLLPTVVWLGERFDGTTLATRALTGSDSPRNASGD